MQCSYFILLLINRIVNKKQQILMKSSNTPLSLLTMLGFKGNAVDKYGIDVQGG
jgi:hypothetical protein